MNTSKPLRSALSGTVLVASGAIGAGMFSLPIVAAGTWTAWAIASLILVWAATLTATLLLAKINLQFEPGASFDTVVGSCLGSPWRTINNLAIWFVLAILLYAYFSAGGNIVSHTAQQLNANYEVSEVLASLIFGLVVALMVWSGSRLVSAVCSILLFGMVATFVGATGGLLAGLDHEILWQRPEAASRFAWYTLPYFVTAFACAGLVPSLIKHYDGDAISVKKSLWFGTLLSLLVYTLWIVANFGTLERAELAPVIRAGGNVGDLASAIQAKVTTTNLPLVLAIFSHFAITTSFLSISLGLFDFLADRFNQSDDKMGRAKTALLTFGPPAVLSAIYPQGFIIAIGYAGLAMLLTFFVIPVVIAYKQKLTSAPTLLALGLFTLVVAICKILATLGLLPSFP